MWGVVAKISQMCRWGEVLAELSVTYPPSQVLFISSEVCSSETQSQGKNFCDIGLKQQYMISRCLLQDRHLLRWG